MDGPGASISGQSSLAGARLAVEELNASGGIAVRGVRHHVRLIERGYENRSDDASSQARALINLDSVDVLIGPQLSPHAVAASSVAEEAHVPMISPMSSNPATTQGKRFVFRLAYLDAVQGEILARYAFKRMEARRAAVLFDVANPYSRDLAALFRKSFEALGGRVVTGEFTSDELVEFRPALRRLAATRPDVLFLPNMALVDSVQMRQARSLGMTATFLGSDAWDPPSLSVVPEATGAIVARQWHEEMPQAEVSGFIARYRARWGEAPRATAAMTYDAIRIAAMAVGRAGTLDGASVAMAIARFGPFTGAGGTVRFTGTGDPERNAVLTVIRGRSDSIVEVVAAR